MGAGPRQSPCSLTDRRGCETELEVTPSSVDCRGGLLGAREPVVAAENEARLPDGTPHQAKASEPDELAL